MAAVCKMTFEKLKISTHHHHWREGNLPQSSKCANCRRTCWSAECLAGMRCEWCGITVICRRCFRSYEFVSSPMFPIQAHAVCYRQVGQECDMGVLRRITLPPGCVSIPRTELPMEQLLSIKRKDKDGASPVLRQDEPSLTGVQQAPPSDEAPGAQGSSGAKDRDDCAFRF